MALSSPSSPSSCLLGLLFFLILSVLQCSIVVAQLSLNSEEQESVYRVLEAVNSDVPWRSLFPDDLCSSAPHGVACDFFVDGASEAVHVTELSFGYVSDYSPNPPCTASSTVDSGLLSPFKHLRKLFFYKCFTERPVFMSGVSISASSLEELVFIENPSLVGSLAGELGNLTSLRRLVLTGTNVSGEIPGGLGDLTNLEEIMLSRNKFSGEVRFSVNKLKKLKVLDLSYNGLTGNIPESIGELPKLLKLDLSSNRFSGKIPYTLKNLKNLEFLDMSYNRFTNSGIPLFLAEMPNLKELYLSGNFFGGHIPEIWDKLGGIVGVGLSRTGLVGNIPASMGAFLRNVVYLGLDNNGLEGTVPEELGYLSSLNELNLENNNLKGRLLFSANFAAKLGDKLKLEGNPELCIDEGLWSPKIASSLSQLKLCKKPSLPNPVPFSGGILPFSGGILVTPVYLVSILGFFVSLMLVVA